jgi:hypothetical protein
VSESDSISFTGPGAGQDQAARTGAPDPLATPRRIAFAGDWHGNTSWAVGAISYAAAEGADVLIHTGDFGYYFTHRFLDTVERALAEVAMPLLFVDGNHENFPTLYGFKMAENGLRPLTEHLWHLPRGFRWTWDGIRFLALGGAHSVDRLRRRDGIDWWPDERITLDDVQRALDGGPTDVLISHDCPAGVQIPGLEQSAHRWPAREIEHAEGHRELLRIVADYTRPSLIWHGHYHVRYRTWEDNLDYGVVMVNGLDCDGTTPGDNIDIVDLAQLAGAAADVAELTDLAGQVGEDEPPREERA